LARECNLVVNGLFVLLHELPFGGVEFVIIAVKRDMAARDHDAALVVLEGPVRQRRRGDRAEVDRAHACILQGLLDCLTETTATIFGESGGAGAEIVRIIKVVSSLDAPFRLREGLEVMDFSDDVGVDLELSQMDDFAAATTGAKFEMLRFVRQVRAKGICSGGGSRGRLRLRVTAR